MPRFLDGRGDERAPDPSVPILREDDDVREVRREGAVAQEAGEADEFPPPPFRPREKERRGSATFRGGGAVATSSAFFFLYLLLAVVVAVVVVFVVVAGEGEGGHDPPGVPDPESHPALIAPGDREPRGHLAERARRGT